jgi:hypothetical protein
MRKLGLILSLLALAVSSASAQVTVEVTLDQDQFLPAEAIWAAVRVKNFSGQSLRLGESADWLALSVEARDGFIVARNSDLPVVGAFTLDNSMVATKRLNLSPCFNLTKPGRYSVTATVRIRDWDKEFMSKPTSFDIIDGVKLWEQEFGVPQSAGEPEVRKYALQQAVYLKQLKLYLRLTDASDTKVLRVFALGPMVSFSRPECQVDKSCKLHVLFQTGARPFLYCVVNPQGDVITRQRYDYLGSRPRLVMDSDGNVTVSGGVRRLTSTDLPPPVSLTVTNAARTPTP